MKKKILIADDERNIVDVVKLRMEREGYDVIVAFDGQEGFDKVKSDQPDLIIMDVAMPKLDGYTAAKMIRKDETTKHIPIIMLTGKDGMKDLFKMEGMNEFVIKPFDFDELIRKVKQFLKRPEDEGDVK